MAPKTGEKAQLLPMPIIGVPFHRIAMDLVGPLEPSAKGHRYILVVLDYATRYPEAIPLRTAITRNIVNVLV